MPAEAVTTTPHGIGARRVDVEAGVAPGLPEFRIVGLPDTAVQESRERIRHAIRQAGAKFPDTKVTINLAPAALRKTGGQTDLAIAIAILRASKQLPPEEKQEKPSALFLGELSLGGELRSQPGALASALLAVREGIGEIIVPSAQAGEAALVPNLSVRPAATLKEVLQHLRGEQALPYAKAAEQTQGEAITSELGLIRGQQSAKRAIAIAAAGGHSLLMVGPPGSGKTLLARALADVLPPLAWEEALEVTQIEGAAGVLDPLKPLMYQRPFRHPHHTASAAALIGGGSPPRPGEITRAHRGVLFLDELPEFPRRTLEALRQPLEDGEICLARAKESWTYPSRCMLVAAMNPCPCGYAGEPDNACRCAPARRERYRAAISGPLADRIDLIVNVSRVPAEAYLTVPNATAKGETQRIRAQVQEARARQEARRGDTGVRTNAELTEQHRKTVLSLRGQEETFLKKAAERYKLSARGMGRAIKVARTIADLQGAQRIEVAHLSEALQFRQPLE